MKFLIVALALVAAASAAKKEEVQGSLVPTDLEVAPARMSATCKKIFEKLQSPKINAAREVCKSTYADEARDAAEMDGNIEVDNADVSCKVRCILEETYFVDRTTGALLIAPFHQGVTPLRKDHPMLERVEAAFDWCYEQAKDAKINNKKDGCKNPVYTKYGLCFWEMVNKLCLMSNNMFSNTDEPWGEKA